MAHVLFGWEFGSGRGHVARMARLAKMLSAEGHRISIAVQRLDALIAEDAGETEAWQGPVSPRLMAHGARPVVGPPGSMADILARLGFDDAGIVTALLSGWDRLFAAARPDVVIADFAPLMLMAARGRIPAIVIGTGFDAPPAGMAEYPRLIGAPSPIDQGRLLKTVNLGLAGAARPPIDSLPQVFAAERELPATFTELDPYAAWRSSTPALPVPLDFDAAVSGGDEVFAYVGERMPADSPLWKGLAAAGLPVRVHALRATAELRDALTTHGFQFEPEPVPFAEIAARSRLVLSHGGHGFTCASLAAGLPHVIFYYDLEKLLHGLALARLGLGGHIALPALEPRAFADSLVKIYRDEAMAARAKAAAPGFLNRGQVPLEPAVSGAVAAIA